MPAQLSQKHFLELLKKYDVPGPRYTSYPTVPAWNEEVGVSDYQQSLGQLKEDEVLSLYFHIPFCESLCHYCGCMKVITKDHNRSKAYVETVLREADKVVSFIPEGTRQVNQFHFGGGTPNFLYPEELEQIVTWVRRHFKLRSDSEVAIEMHPRTSTKEFCDKLRDLEFNRISLGVQDFDPKVQKLINRNQTYEMTEEMISYLRKLGFDSFNFDLVYGLPGQSMQEWSKTLEKVLHLRPNRLAVYSYAHVPWVHPVQRTFEDSDIPPPQLKLELFEKAYAIFTQNGYSLIGMDHFALHDDELSKALREATIHRNFMGYTTRADAHQVGFGVSSISYVAGNYFQNLKKIKEYDAAIQSNGMATFRGFLVSHDDKIRRDLIMQIMCRAFVDIDAFEKMWSVNFKDYFSSSIPKLSTFVEDGLLEVTEKKIQVIDHGFLFLRNIAMCFDAHLEGIKSRAKTPTFSRTV